RTAVDSRARLSTVAMTGFYTRTTEGPITESALTLRSTRMPTGNGPSSRRKAVGLQFPKSVACIPSRSRETRGDLVERHGTPGQTPKGGGVGQAKRAQEFFCWTW